MGSFLYPCGVKNVRCNPVIITDPETWTPPWFRATVILPELLAELASGAWVMAGAPESPEELFAQVTRSADYWEGVSAQLQEALDASRPVVRSRATVYADAFGKTRRPALIHVAGRVYAQIGTPTEDAGAPRKASTPTESRAAREQVEAVLAQSRQLATTARKAELLSGKRASAAALDAVKRLGVLR